VKSLKFVTQTELENARLGKRTSVLPEACRIQYVDIDAIAGRIEPDRVRQIERLGAELESVLLVPDGVEVEPFTNA
jgi:hypothetical protein